MLGRSFGANLGSKEELILPAYSGELHHKRVSGWSNVRHRTSSCLHVVTEGIVFITVYLPSLVKRVKCRPNAIAIPCDKRVLPCYPKPHSQPLPVMQKLYEKKSVIYRRIFNRFAP